MRTRWRSAERKLRPWLPIIVSDTSRLRRLGRFSKRPMPGSPMAHESRFTVSSAFSGDRFSSAVS
eukprot:822908-Prorocentrum_minimum.AAC.1